MEPSIVCNIAEPGVIRRRNVGIAVGIAAALLLAALVALGSPWWARALVALPAGVCAVSLLQARRRTCVAHARRGTIELVDFAVRRAPEDVATASRRVAATIVRDAAVAAALIGALAAASAWAR